MQEFQAQCEWAAFLNIPVIVLNLPALDTACSRLARSLSSFFSDPTPAVQVVLHHFKILSFTRCCFIFVWMNFIQENGCSGMRSDQNAIIIQTLASVYILLHRTI